MRRSARRPLMCESLDSRLLLSTSTIALPAAQIAHISASASALNSIHQGRVQIHGSATGKYQVHLSFMEDVPDRYTLSKATHSLQYKIGQTQPKVVQTEVEGMVFGIGFVARGRSTGSLVLKTAEGQVTLDLTGPEARGFQPPAKHYTYVVQKGSGTGMFAQASGTGTVKLDLVRTRPSIDSPDAGTYRIQFA